MIFFNRNIKKRLPLAVFILLISIPIIGFVMGFIFSPVSKDEYLHNNTLLSEAEPQYDWQSADQQLPSQDRSDITHIINLAEYSNSYEKKELYLTGQALQIAEETRCNQGALSCSFPVRINRRFYETHVNNDFRVVNIEEKSMQIELMQNNVNKDLSIVSINHEKRILRFYQTQTGWVQNIAEVLERKKLPSSIREYIVEEEFQDKFSKKYTGINYYPASASWRDFWVKFPLAAIKQDMKKIHQVNANAIRIFLNHDYFDNSETRDEALSKLNIFLDLCKAENIHVLVTLFDLRPYYAFANWDADVKHIEFILSNIADHEAILAIDVKNQADLDFKNWGQGVVESWLRVMVKYINIHYPDLPLTVGWSTPHYATRLHDVVDVVTYHEYINPEGFEKRLETIISNAEGKPVMITELGSTTWRLPFFEGFTEAAQAVRLITQLKQATHANGLFIWTLNDFETIDSTVVGPLPWRKMQQKHFGLFRIDGSARPSAEIFKTYAASVKQKPHKTP